MHHPLPKPATKVSVNLYTDNIEQLRAYAAENRLTGIGTIIRHVVARWCAEHAGRKPKPKPHAPLHPRFFLEEDTDDHD